MEAQREDGEYDEAHYPVSPPLLMAREYLANARRIGEPGSLTMIEGAALLDQHASMAQTAALVSIAESLHGLARSSGVAHRRIAKAAGSLDTLASELTKLRYLAKGRRI